ncbi:MAG: LysE family translocator [Pseudomonadota bacterium]
MIEVLTVLAGVFLAQVSPGPNMVAVASAAFGSGRGAALLTAAGVATGVFIWALLFLFGIGAVLAAYPVLLTAMKLIGGGYLLWLGVKAGLSALSAGGGPGAVAPHPATGRGAYLRGLLVVLTNPKAAMMWVAVSLFLAASGFGNWQFVGMGLLVAGSALAVYGTYALLFSTGIALRGYARAYRTVDAGFGLIFGGLGARLAWDGAREALSRA